MFLMKDAVNLLCEEARGIAVPAVDAFGLSDLILRSPLGQKDGVVLALLSVVLHQAMRFTPPHGILPSLYPIHAF
jgi:hypothetical protein